MTDNPTTAIETMRAGLGDPDAHSQRDIDPYDIPDPDREALLDLSDQIQLLGPSQYSDHRHEFLLRRGLTLAREVGGIADAAHDRDAAERLVSYINSEQTGSPETNKDYRVALRNIGKILTDGDDFPESVEWIPGGYPKNYDPAPDPGLMLTWEDDIQPMLDACLNPRDRALVTLAWDLGPRPGELFDLQYAAVTDHRYGLQVTLDGKTGRRSPVLVPSAPYVTAWRDAHPGGGTDPLFGQLGSGASVSDNRIRQILKEVAERAGVDKPVTPSNFRKSSASYLASQGVSQAHLEDHHGWTRGSEIAARYIAVFDDANKREIARAHGLDVEADEPDALGPVTCPRCERETPREKDFCMHCSQMLDRETMELLDEVMGTLDEELVDSDDPGDRQDLVRARRTLEEKPGVMDRSELHELASSLSSDAD